LIKQISCKFTSPNQFLLDWGIGIVVFGTDCVTLVKTFGDKSWKRKGSWHGIVNTTNGNLSIVTCDTNIQTVNQVRKSITLWLLLLYKKINS